jgi:outer membrane biosynthesis protein TonB
MLVNWEQYVKRRRVDIAAWLKGKNISTYQGLVEECKKRSIIPPKYDVVKEFLAESLNASIPQPVSRPISGPRKPKQVPKRRPPDKPVPRPVKVPTREPAPRPKKIPIPVKAPEPKVPEPAPIIKEPERAPQSQPITKRPEKIVWNFMMKKAELLKLAISVGIDDLSMKSTKAQIVGALVKAGHPESQA